MEEGLLQRRPASEGKERSRGLLAGVRVLDEAGRLGRLAAPMVAVTLSQFMLTVVSMMMVGHLGELALSGTAIASSFISVTGFSLLVSSPSPIDLLLPAWFSPCRANTRQ